MTGLRFFSEVFSWWIPVACFMVAFEFCVGLNQYEVVRDEIWERYPEDIISLIAYFGGFITGLLMFFESGGLILQIIYNDIDLGPGDKVDLSLTTFPILVVIVLVFVIALSVIGHIGGSVSFSVAKEKLDDKIQRREERTARIEEKIEKEREAERR